MAFPTTGVLDAFGGTAAGWTNPISALDPDLLVVSGGQASFTVNGAGGYWNASSFGPDSEAFATLSVLSQPLRLYVRINPTGGSSAGYAASYNPLAGAVTIYRLDIGGFNALGADITATLANGDSLGFEAIGQNLTAYQKSGGSWTPLGTRTDATYNQVGRIGVTGIQTIARVDDFGGGTVVPPPPPPLADLPQPIRASTGW